MLPADSGVIDAQPDKAKGHQPMVTTILNLIIFGLLFALVVLPLSMLLFRSWQERKERYRDLHRAKPRATSPS